MSEIIVVLGPEGSGTTFVAKTISKIMGYKYVDFHEYTYQWRVRGIEEKEKILPMVMHVSIPDGRPDDICINGKINPFSWGMINAHTLITYCENDLRKLRLVICYRNPRKAIFSAYKRFYTKDSPLQQHKGLMCLGAAVKMYRVAANRIAEFRMLFEHYNVCYEHAIENPKEVFAGLAEYLGGIPLDQYKIKPSDRKPRYRDIIVFNDMGVPDTVTDITGPSSPLAQKPPMLGLKF